MIEATAAKPNAAKPQRAVPRRMGSLAGEGTGEEVRRVQAERGAAGEAWDQSSMRKSDDRVSGGEQ